MEWALRLYADVAVMDSGSLKRAAICRRISKQMLAVSSSLLPFLQQLLLRIKTTSLKTKYSPPRNQKMSQIMKVPISCHYSEGLMVRGGDD